MDVLYLILNIMVNINLKGEYDEPEKKNEEPMLIY